MAETRKYALIHVSDGDYLCPSNDQRHLWRFRRYDEDDGSLSRHDGTIIRGSFWAAYRRPMPVLLDQDPEELLNGWSGWELWEDLLPTRAKAIDVMLKNP